MKNIIITFVFTFFFINMGKAQSADTQTIQIKTSAVCDMCKKKIEKDLSYEKGVKEAQLDVETSILTVSYKPNKTSPEKIKEAVSKIGYDADETEADPKAYNKLDDCCKKTAGKH